MSPELFRTVVPVYPVKTKISYRSHSVFMGSCFTENIGEKLSWYKFPVCINPFGIIYNPFSIKKNLERLISGKNYVQEDLDFYNGLYFSYDHHSRFSDTNPDSCLRKINSELTAAHEGLKKSSCLFLTFGTSYYYALNTTGMIVSNCHKLPDKVFSRSRLTPAEIVNEFSSLIPNLLQLNPELKIVFTVSPIRHWKDGAHENQVSKSVLFVAIDDICRKFDNCIYFPAYELMMDELRDYRFYEEDMIHPDKTAINFIWKRFSGCFIDEDTVRIMSEVEKIALSAQHRPFNPGSESFNVFVKKNIENIKRLNEKFPEIDLSTEYKYFTSFQ